MPSPTTTPNQITTTGHTYDGTGNPTALANSANANAFNLRYDPYGAVTRLDSAGNTGGWNDNPDLFHGGVQDRATGNIKFGQRFYNPTTGNWTQQDPINAPWTPITPTTTSTPPTTPSTTATSPASAAASSVAPAMSFKELVKLSCPSRQG